MALKEEWSLVLVVFQIGDSSAQSANKRDWDQMQLNNASEQHTQGPGAVEPLIKGQPKKDLETEMVCVETEMVCVDRFIHIQQQQAFKDVVLKQRWYVVMGSFTFNKSRVLNVWS